ncbi:MAG: SDR family oxidoreductase [Methanomicrobiales archaeon]|nr:SDR family oxidoreductase [Methanomicrobiales archaeon]
MGILEEKVAVISGSTQGIGKSIAREMLTEGAHVWITGRNHERLDSAASEFRDEFGDHVHSFEGDLTRLETIRDLIRSMTDESGRLDVVVANIGSGKSKMGWDVEDAIFRESFEINFFPAVALARESLRVMVGQKSGCITFIASIAGLEAIPAPVPYSAAKAALLRYMKSTAPVVAPSGIRMNAVSPGNVYVEGGTWGIRMKDDPVGTKRYIEENVPMKRFGIPGEIGRLVCFLSSDQASFITGSNIIIDGGQTRGL